MNIQLRIGFFFKVLVPVLLWINVCATDPKLSETMTKMKAVKDRIFNGYDKTIRPTREGSNTTEVSTGLMPRQILDVDEEKGIFALDSYFVMVWEDPRLTWNSTTEYDGYLQLPTDLLWIPDISVHNSHSLQVNPTQQVMLLILPTGTVIWVPPILTETSCPSLSQATYPSDVVTCMVEMGSWVHDGWEIDFTHEEHLYMDEFLNIHSRWEVLVPEVRMIRNVTYWEEYSEPYLFLDAVFPLKRRPPPEIEATRNPCILIMLLVLSIFWMPPDSSKKLMIGGISFLALIILLVYVACSTRFSLGVIFAVSFLQSTMYIAVATLLLQVLVIFNLCNISGPVRPPPAVMQFLSGPFGKYALLRPFSSSDNIQTDQMQLKEDSPFAITSPTPKDDWMMFAAGLDRLFFILMSVAMIAIHHL
uniref:Nicotinic acetylcholine receptor non-alpha subunit variant b n=1 Tax=Cupiennius salei TaxID=6928 RepID=A0A0M4P8A3_CUPSA|nr:nicotinic acetylcholine receptor non-alpha subunit variant b [Cupiennius salei]